ncbi:GRAM domain-containing protein 3 [Liparis tanakae]|uniref:GRAM domain-containing protein 3 n=1 Tax=Liparis tanakae TaxID=230148 RepID=A0A4Z2FSW2_9TELE|nr:GRAM domain-containing protein 3 [Liparis tanakae]
MTEEESRRRSRRVQTDLDCKIERKKSHYSQLSKSNCQYHKIFKEISKEEQLRQSKSFMITTVCSTLNMDEGYTCALQKDILYQGRMFVSDHWICFHSKVFGKDTKIAIPVMSATHIKKTNTAILLPNALVIATANDRYVFVSFMSRDNTYKFLMSISPHLEEKSPCSSPVISSAANSFREFPAAPLLHTLKQPGGAAPPEHPDLQHKGKNQHQKQNQDQHQNPDRKQLDKRHAGSELRIYGRTIVSLEQRLTTLGSVADFPDQENDFLRGSGVNAELFSELLTINLMKLEKVQKNLQRLLDEAT